MIITTNNDYYKTTLSLEINSDSVSNKLNKNDTAYCTHQQKNIYDIPEKFGIGKIYIISINDHIDVIILDAVFKEQTRITGSCDESPLGFSILITGDMKTETYKISQEHLLTEGDLCFGYTPYSEGYCEMPAGKHISQISIYLAPQFLDNYVEDNSLRKQLQLDNIINEKNIRPYEKTVRINTKVFALAKQILNFNFSHCMEKMYLESKILEIVSMQLSGLTENTRYNQTNSFLSKYDKEKILMAKEYLDKNISQSPGLFELAKSFGLNEFKLKTGFKDIFNATVYGYLRNERMEYAKILLDQENKSISEVSSLVGYSNASHFSYLFRKKYGVNPSVYQKQKME
jgi:AraC family transcriptional regulator, transcriptional activator of the genes for pyochelin and ferripyochelin receptors